MIEIRNGKLIIGSVAFEPPDSFFIDPSPGTINDYGLVFQSPSGDYRISVDGYVDDRPQTGEITFDFDTEEFTFIEPQKEISINGLKGVCAIYRNHIESYFEAQFRMPKNDDDLQIFAIRVSMIGSDEQVCEVTHSDAVQKLLHSISPVQRQSED